MKRLEGFTLVEIILAIAVFALITTVMISAYVYGRQATQLSGNRSRASQLANEGMEAIRNIANPNYSNLSNYSNGTTYYLVQFNNQWQLTTIPSQIDGLYTRTLVFSDGPNGSRQLTVSVTWQQTLQRQGSMVAKTYFANWRQPTSAPIKSGLFVYANGGLSSDYIGFKQLLSSGAWTEATILPDIDPGSTNRVPRSLKLYSAQTGSAKMVISRHFNGSSQFLYATYWNGTVFAQPQLLAQWNSSAALNSGNYGGDYLSDGSFVAVYYDGTNIPKSRVFNGSSWGPPVSLGAIGSSSNYVTAMMTRARPNSNDMMAIFLTNNYDVNTSFYSNGVWSPYTVQTDDSAGNGSLLVDFDWNMFNPITGVALYTNSTNNRALRARTFSVTGSGTGDWLPADTSSNIPSGRRAVSLRGIARPNTADENLACMKDSGSPASIYCYEYSPSTGFTTPSNNVITNSSVSGVQITFDVAYKYSLSNDGVIAYSDGTRSGKVKIYNSAGNSWSTNPVALPNAVGIIEKTRIVGRPNSDEVMLLVADSNTDVYSVVLNGTNNTLFTFPSGKSWTAHGTAGPTNDAVWYDFAWDN